MDSDWLMQSVEADFCNSSCGVLVVEDYIRQPDVVGGDSDFFDAVIFIWVPH